jgi:hypothetical protein
VATERWRDGGEERWWLELIARAEEGERELRSEGKRCEDLWGWWSSFIGGWEGWPGR